VIKVKELAPWQWMGEADLFGVQDPETGEVYYVSVMGELGEHFAIAAYPGAKGLNGFWTMNQGILEESPEVFVLVPQLQASFEDRAQLTDQDRRLIKDLGYQFRGRQAWPLFRSYRPAYLPWYLEAAEATVLALVLEQVLEMAPRFREDRQVLEVTSDGAYLVRVAREVDGAVIWEDRRITVTFPPPPTITIEMDLHLLAYLKGLPRSKDMVEIGVAMLPAPVRETGSRPFFPFIVLVVEARSGMILGHEMLDARPGMDMMWGQVTLSVAKALALYQLAPRVLKVANPLLEGLLQPLAAELGAQVKLRRRLPALEEARTSLFAFMR
jgi:hypothetical protein